MALRQGRADSGAVARRGLKSFRNVIFKNRKQHITSSGYTFDTKVLKKLKLREIIIIIRHKIKSKL